jgi:uncharacterized membrane-anchored protein YjiN (DUF445 family)
MKRRATGLLVGCGVVLVVARLLEGRWPWLVYLRVTAEAALIGGFADWFAVTALFRHPLGLKIPHTAIVPARKQRIGRSLGRFVESNFLAPQVIAGRVAALQPGERLVRWLADPAHAQQVSGAISSGMASAAGGSLGEEDVWKSLEGGLATAVRTVRVAPLLGRLLTVFRTDPRYQEFVDEGLRLALRATVRNEQVIRERVREESPWWIPEAIDDRMHEKIVGAIERTFAAALSDRQHALRLRLDRGLGKLAEELSSSQAMAERLTSLSDDALAHPAVREFARTIVQELKAALRERRGVADPELIERTLVGLAQAALADERLLVKIDRVIVDAIVYTTEVYGREAARFIEETVDSWDADAAARKIELQVGSDLQFIRINGTVVGGLVGLLLYVLGQLF